MAKREIEERWNCPANQSALAETIYALDRPFVLILKVAALSQIQIINIEV